MHPEKSLFAKLLRHVLDEEGEESKKRVGGREREGRVGCIQIDDLGGRDVLGDLA